LNRQKRKEMNAQLRDRDPDKLWQKNLDVFGSMTPPFLSLSLRLYKAKDMESLLSRFITKPYFLSQFQAIRDLDKKQFTVVNKWLFYHYFAITDILRGDPASLISSYPKTLEILKDEIKDSRARSERFKNLESNLLSTIVSGMRIQSRKETMKQLMEQLEPIYDDFKVVIRVIEKNYRTLLEVIPMFPPLDRDYEVFRGVSIKSIDPFSLFDEKKDDLGDLQKGDEVTFKSVFSTTFNPIVALEFSGDEECCLFRIKLKRGLKCIYLSTFDHQYFNQLEIVVPPSILKVTNISTFKREGKNIKGSKVIFDLEWIELYQAALGNFSSQDL
jgi:hypothetical protein